LQVIVCSTRPGRVGIAIAKWFFELAVAHDDFDVELVDLLEVNLPVFDEPNHPMKRDYVHEHTRNWSKTIDRGDGYVFVIPEYNHSMNAATKNAIDYLHWEWKYKPYGIVCYGGASMGLRAAQVLKPTMAALKVTLCGDVSVPLMTTPVKDGVFEGNDILAIAAKTVLDEIAKFAPILKSLRSAPVGELRDSNSR
jgi:NAD(P)H-dependent FMN reductase